MGSSLKMSPSIPSSSHLLVFILFIGVVRADFLPTNPLADLACKVVNCGEGVCVPSNGTSLLPFDCQCKDGWKNIQFGNVEIPSCIVPNCTMNFTCGDQAPPPPPPALNLTDPCGLTWCGDGSCAPEGSPYTCKCNQGSANLMNNPILPCFKECYFGADCVGLGFGPQSPPPSKSGSPRNGTLTAPPPSPSNHGNICCGQSGVPYSSRTQNALTMLLLIAGTFLSFF